MVVLVTGASGQLGQAIQFIAKDYGEIEFVYTDSDEADITDKLKLKTIFERVKPNYCINAAAYTAVDKAESEQDKAYTINVTGAKNLAEICGEFGATLIHVSTDFVFDGTGKKPYTEEDKTNPLGVYGKTKRDGEIEIQKALKEHYIIRTSWLYSQFGNNFMKTMLRLSKERDTLGVVSDQIGTPTHAVDLAKAIMKVITSNAEVYGLYHFSNEGIASWYDFAHKIFEINNVAINLNPIPTSAYPTPAKRPEYSVLSKQKIKDTFGIIIKKWEESLEQYKD